MRQSGRGRRAIAGLFAGALAAASLAAVGAVGIPSAGADPGAGTVIVQVSELSGSYGTGFCLQPGTLTLGGSVCGVTGSTQYLDTFPAGASVARSLAAGTYNAGVASLTPLALGGTGVIEVVDGESITCTFSMTAASTCAPTPGPDPGTVIVHVDEASSGSFASGFCAAPGVPVLLSTICSDTRPTNIQFGLSAGSVVAVSMAPGSYSGALASVGTPVLGPAGPVEVRSSQTLVCSFTLGAAPSCQPSTGTVVVQVAEPTVGDFAAGFCGAPGNPVSGTVICTDGHSLEGVFSLQSGESRSVTLPAGDYNAGLARTIPLSSSPNGSLEVLPGQTTVCSFTMAAAPTCAPAGDGDGVAEPPVGFPATYDGNGDGMPDALQGNVTSLLPAVGSSPVTIASPTGTTLTNVTAGLVPSSPAPPAGASFPVGLLGFSVVLAPGATAADVDVILPAGSTPISYYKFQGGAWADFTTHVSFAGNIVTLHLVDGDAFDTNPAVGIIGDPGGPSIDVTPPTVVCPTTPPTFLLNQAGASITATVTDSGSGPAAGSVTVSVPTGSVGPGAVSVTGADVAGNHTTVSCAFSVTYAFTGFSAPIDNPPIVNSAKAGSNVPVKWRITDANGVGIADPASFVSVTSNGSGCTLAALVDAIETYSGNSGLQYLGNGYWQFNWKTPKGYAGQCRRMSLNLADGVNTRTAEFKFK